jgi:lipopolysaccharide/colanic/teichoic acid biosynthesis glycosyltransferase
MFESSRIALRRQPAAISVAAPLRLSGLAPGPWDRPWDHPGDRPGERPGDRPEDRPGERAKRVEDILVASLLLLLLGVPMLMIALLVRLDSCGPALFRQQRTGLDGRSFWMLKFRTMHHGVPEAGPALRQATRRDRRVTRFGALLRRTSLDELPQLINVLRGEMSVVGPRPHAPGTCAGGRPFEQITPRYGTRHCVRPGLTGLAQVRGLRGETETEDKLVHRLEADLEYIERWSLWLDMTVLARTTVAVLRMKNAY